MVSFCLVHNTEELFTLDPLQRLTLFFFHIALGFVVLRRYDGWGRDLNVRLPVDFIYPASSGSVVVSLLQRRRCSLAITRSSLARYGGGGPNLGAAMAVVALIYSWHHSYR